MGFIDRRKPRQRGRYKSTDFMNLAEAKSFAAMGPLPKYMPFVFMDKFTQGRCLNEIGINSKNYVAAIMTLEKTFK